MFFIQTRSDASLITHHESEHDGGNVINTNNQILLISATGIS